MKYGILINKRNYSCSWNITVDRGYHHYQYRNYSCLRKGKKKVLEASIEVEAASSSNVLDDTILIGSTGLFFLFEWKIWNNLMEVDFWWAHSMILSWILFSIVFFVLDPYLLKKIE